MWFIQSHVKDQCSTDGGLQLLRLVVTALVNLDTGHGKGVTFNFDQLLVAMEAILKGK